MQEIDDDTRFEVLLADKKHKEVRSALAAISNALSQKNDDAVLDALEKNANAIKLFAEAIGKIPKPELNVAATDVSELEKIGSNILKGQ